MAGSINTIVQSTYQDVLSTVAGQADIGQLLKHLYADWDIESLVNLTTPLLPRVVRRGSATLGGNGFYFPVRQSAAEGHAFIADNGVLPASAPSVVEQAVVQPKVQVGIVELTGLARAISSGNAAAFASAFDENVTSVMQAMMAYREGALFRDGTGVLATVDATDILLPTLVFPATGADVGFLREGMLVQIYDISLQNLLIFNAGAFITMPDGSTATRVTAVDWVARSVTLGATGVSVPIAAGDQIILAGTQGNITVATALATREPEGLAASISVAPTTGTYLGLARTTRPNWQNSAIALNGFLDEDAVLRMRTRISQESGVTVQAMGRDFGVCTHPTQVDILFKLAIPKIRYSGNEKFDFGYNDTVYFGNIPFYTSHQCQTNRAYIGDWSYSQELIVPGGELGIDSDLNGSSLKWLDRQDAGLVLIKGYFNWIVKNPTRFGVWSGLTDATR